MEFIRDETRAILETAIAEKTNLLDLRDKEISSLKQSIETLKRSAEVKQRKFEDKLSEEKSKHELELMIIWPCLEVLSECEVLRGRRSRCKTPRGSFGATKLQTHHRGSNFTRDEHEEHVSTKSTAGAEFVETRRSRNRSSTST